MKEIRIGPPLGSSPEEYKKFIKWAFGKEPPCNCSGEELVVAWNLLHCELMELKETDMVGETYPKMLEFWLESMNPKEETWKNSGLRWSDK